MAQNDCALRHTSVATVVYGGFLSATLNFPGVCFQQIYSCVLRKLNTFLFFLKVSFFTLKRDVQPDCWRGSMHAGESFFTTGLIVLQKNYLEVYPYDSW